MGADVLVKYEVELLKSKTLCLWNAKENQNQRKNVQSGKKLESTCTTKFKEEMGENDRENGREEIVHLRSLAKTGDQSFLL